MKIGMNLSEAARLLRGIKVPSELANSIEIVEAIRIGIAAIDKQIDLGQLIQDLKDDFGDNPDTPFCYEYLDMELKNLYVLSEVNNFE